MELLRGAGLPCDAFCVVTPGVVVVTTPCLKGQRRVKALIIEENLKLKYYDTNSTTQATHLVD